MKPLKFVSLGALLITLPLLSGCGPSDSTSASSASTTPKVVAAFYPLQYAAQHVGGTNVSVTNLTQPGVEPHDLELSAAQVAEISQADLVLYIKGFQPAVDDAVAQQAPDRSIDVTSALTLLTGPDGADPHVWLDPANMSKIGNAIADRLAVIEPDKAAAFAKNSDTLATSMNALSKEFSAGLATCKTKSLVVSHDAFGYLAQAFGFTQVGISGLNPEAEPSPARMRAVAEVIKANNVSTIYYETLVDPKVAQTIADETGAAAVMLDPLEGLAPNSTDDYVSVMKANLAALKKGQECS
jgi:zinc transport system substrate-binding protein